MSLLILPRRFRDSHFEIGLGIGLKGEYKVQICRNGHVVREPFGPKMLPNLITNAGLDLYMTFGAGQPFAQALTAARIGSGTNPPSNSDTALQTQLKNTQNLFTGGGNTYSNDTVNGAWTATYVYEFTAEVGTVTYNELGLASAPAGATLVTRALFPTGVTLNSGDNMRLTYSFTYSIPALVTQIPVSLSAVNGFNISGNLKVCGLFSNIFGTINTTDTGTNGPGTPSGNLQGVLCGSVAAAVALLSAPTSFPAVNVSLSETVISGATGSSALATYTTGSFTRNQTATWLPNQPSSTVSNVNMLAFRYSASTGLYLLLSSAQTKANTNTLTVTWSTSVSRV